ncbi:cyclic pyranopterin monophosphate synthase [Paenibacillus albidus]|uniref:GTP 3',8-cyclase n=1 Tax=Paenibacillus albidus TaxID=2041023 RepID=A0A917CKQ9_9BACL|nr:GTP 3',8-cyclase MoaA [Paenibacillus albidus]GGF88745.1 cyclic pyranopterin monophosphate synthase [Paenibacillus albidus]
MTLDKLNRPLKDLRISVTDRCNLRCVYCMPKEIFGPDYKFLGRDDLLSFDEIEQICRSFASLGGKKLRLTGGEPLLRGGLPRLIGRLSRVEGIEDIALTTNGLLLPRFASDLYAAGLKRVNVSLDSLDDARFGAINGLGVGVQGVLDGMKAAADAGLQVKVNMVVKKSSNEQDIIPMARYFKDTEYILRFIEFMDVGNTNGWDLSQVITRQQIVDMIDSVMPLTPIAPQYEGEVAARYRYTGTDREIGIISSITQSFCSSCSRARLSADGSFYTCLFASRGFDLRTLLRTDISGDELTEKLRQVWNNREDRYSDLRSLEGTGPSRGAVPKIEMSYIGG